MATTVQASSSDVTNGRLSSHVSIETEGIAKLSTQSVFQARPAVLTPYVLKQMERRDRIVLILLDGKRSIQDVTRLIHRSEIEVAQTLVRLLKGGYINYMGTQSVQGGETNVSQAR